MKPIIVKRIYDHPEITDGVRILVDRLWPRGVTKEAAQLTLWMKDIAPSPQLRLWFHHAPERFEAFKARYTAELSSEEKEPYVEQLIQWSDRETLTLLFAAKDRHVNHAVVLKQYLEQLGNR